MSVSSPVSSDWPLLRIALPPGADDDSVSLLTAEAVARVGALGAAVEGNTLAIYLPRDADLESAPVEGLKRWLSAQAESFGWETARATPERLADAPWATAWKDRFQSLPIGKRLLIRPDWEREIPVPSKWADRAVIYLRPGQGFGTGHHETTRLALTALEEALLPGDTVLDLGTGSGVLSLAAIRLGAESAVAIDFDPQALLNARENLEINGLENRIELREGNRPILREGGYSLVVCNMLPQEAVHLLPALAESLGGVNPRLIYTGFLADQISEVKAGLSGAGLSLLRECTDGEWCGVIAVPAK